jgi:hypothetical protein
MWLGNDPNWCMLIWGASFRNSIKRSEFVALRCSLQLFGVVSDRSMAMRMHPMLADQIKSRGPADCGCGGALGVSAPAEELIDWTSAGRPGLHPLHYIFIQPVLQTTYWTAWPMRKYLGDLHCVPSGRRAAGQSPRGSNALACSAGPMASAERLTCAEY